MRRRIICLLMTAVLVLASLSACSLQRNQESSTIQTPETSAAKTQNEDSPGGSEKQKETSEAEMRWAEKLSVIEPDIISSQLTADEFDGKLIAYLSAHTEGSYMASPLSFRYALGLLLAGARGETRTELLKALGVNNEAEWRRGCELFNGFTEQFAMNLAQEQAQIKREKEFGYLPQDTEEPFRALKVANSVWKREDITADFTEDYRAVIESSYGAEYRGFTPANAISLINDWAKVKTEGLIDKLLPEGYDTDSLAIVLMNALYFKDSWTDSFPKSLTEEGDFKANGGTTRKSFMHKTDIMSYYEDANSRMVLLPMDGGLTMAVVIGDASHLAAMTANTERCRVDLTLPKIDLETSFDQNELVDFLKENGVTQTFSDDADFSGMIDWPVCASDIVQKTRIKLDEEGVEAAAVTAIALMEAAFESPIKEVRFTADEPFSFFIYTEAGDFPAVLFAGEIRE